jgi:hypothetical protein
MFSIASRRHAHAQQSPRERRGFAMFLSIGALVIIGVLVAGSAFVSLQEQRLGQNSMVQTRAFTVAEYGLNKIQTDWDKTPNLQMANGATFDTSYQLAGQGTANVHYVRLNDETFWIVSEGRASAGNLGGSREAVKRVGAVLRLRIPTIKAEGAITAGGNVAIRGGANIQGRDSVPPGWSSDCNGISEVDKAGVIVPIGATVTTQGSSWVQGVPPTKQDPLAADQNTYIRFGDETWNTLVAQANVTLNGGTLNQVAPDSLESGSCNKANIYNWGEPKRGLFTVGPCYNYFPIIYSNGSITLNGQGRGQGILLVNGNVAINGHFEWHGLIIVSNDIVRGNGSATVFGGVMARNEVKADESLITGTTHYNYSSCALERAMRGSAQVVQAKERAWTELY